MKCPPMARETIPLTGSSALTFLSLPLFYSLFSIVFNYDLGGYNGECMVYGLVTSELPLCFLLMV